MSELSPRPERQSTYTEQLRRHLVPEGPRFHSYDRIESALSVNKYAPESSLAGFLVLFLQEENTALSARRGVISATHESKHGRGITQNLTVLKQIRDEREKLGDRMFGDRAKEVITTIETQFAHIPSGVPVGHLRRMEASRKALLAEISREFPESHMPRSQEG